MSTFDQMTNGKCLDFAGVKPELPEVIQPPHRNDL